MKREYPPAALVHATGCPDALLLLALPVADIARDYPNGRPHTCLNPNHATRAAVETVSYPPHDYEPSTINPDDATRALCAICRGTHGVLDGLFLPDGAR